MVRRSAVTALALALALALGAPAAFAGTHRDTVYVLEPVDVDAERIRFGAETVTPGRDDLNRALETLGLTLVRRGVGLASDVSYQGFQRAAIGVVVDGERYHCACPNRMDPPTSLAIPIELASATRDASASEVGAALGGRLALERAVPGERLGLRGGLTSSLASQRDVNGSLALEGRGQRLAARWTEGVSHADGRGRDFGALYGYRTHDVAYTQGDLSLRGGRGALAYGLQHSATRDVPFPYLQMDERDNRLTHASLSRAGHKLYANRADHLMDNGLRTSIATSRMSTDADQTTVGLTGRVGRFGYDAFQRAWDAHNVIATATARVANHILPDVRQWAVNLSGSRTRGALTGSARIGWTRIGVTDRLALAHHRALVPAAPAARAFVPFAVSLSARGAERAGITPGVALEAAAESPTAEQLYITVRRPGMPAMRRPDWVGNPALDAPRRFGGRASLRHAHAALEGGLSWLPGHVLPVAARAGAVRYQTYRGVDALLASLTLSADAGPLELRGAWVSGQDLDAEAPLAEIAPLNGSLTWRVDVPRGVRLFARAVGAARARRPAVALGETATPAWARLDLGSRWSMRRGLALELEIENLTDALYTQHLSYLRDPFAAGVRVWEPGRVVTARLSFDH